MGIGAGGLVQDVSTKLVPGGQYSLKALANVTAVAEGVWVGISFHDAAGNVLMDQKQLVTSLSSVNVSVSFTAPQGFTKSTVYVWKNANAAVGVIDNVSLATASA